jgi:site-specific recombinase XerD
VSQLQAARPPKLLDRVRIALRVRHYALRTERAYVGWIRRYIHDHGIRHPDEMGAVEVVEFLSHLAVDRQVTPSTQNQALSALLFLYREVLGRELEGLAVGPGHLVQDPQLASNRRRLDRDAVAVSCSRR